MYNVMRMLLVIFLPIYHKGQAIQRSLFCACSMKPLCFGPLSIIGRMRYFEYCFIFFDEIIPLIYTQELQLGIPALNPI